MVNSHFFYCYVHFEYLEFENSMTRYLNRVRLVTQYIDQTHFYIYMIRNVCTQVCKNRCEIGNDSHKIAIDE